MALANWLKQACVPRAHREALITTRGNLDYRALHERTGAMLGRMVADGLVPGEPLGIISRKAERIALAAYVASRGGNCLLPLPPDRSKSDLERLIRDAGVRQVLTDNGLGGLLPEKVRGLSTEWLDAPVAGAGVSAPPLSSNEIQLLIATSGSSGAPRCVMLSGNNLEASVMASRERLGLEPGDVWLACLPLYHIGGFSILLRCAEAGATVLLHEGFNSSRVLEDLEAQTVTHISLVPPMLARLLDEGGRPPPCLRVALVGGGRLAGELAARARELDWPIRTTYGMSETASQVATSTYLSAAGNSGDVGPPLDGVKVEIVADNGRPTTEIGRIRVSGPVVMAGYATVGGISGVGLTNGEFVSGDRGYLDGSGRLHVVGRADDMLISAGRNIHPEEVEARMAACPGIFEVGVSAYHDDAWGDYLAAIYVGEIQENELENWCRANLPSTLRPRTAYKRARLPRNPMGKLDRERLRRIAGNQAV